MEHDYTDMKSENHEYRALKNKIPTYKKQWVVVN